MLDEDAGAYSVSRSLEAYLMWLFGYIMFNNTQGNSIDNILMSYAREIADGTEEDGVPSWSWGSAILAATYHGLCDACTKTEVNGVFSGCSFFLQLWSYERIAIARPRVDHSPYEMVLYGETEDARPTMATLWVCREVRIDWITVSFVFLYCEYVSNIFYL